MPDDPYRAAIGRSRNELETPALLLDLDVARQNIAAMAGHMERAGKSLRPHTKTHKAPQIARLQVDAGAIGVSTATAWEAIVMIDAGIDDILVANEVVGPDADQGARRGRPRRSRDGGGRQRRRTSTTSRPLRVAAGSARSACSSRSTSA